MGDTFRHDVQGPVDYTTRLPSLPLESLLRLLQKEPQRADAGLAALLLLAEGIDGSASAQVGEIKDAQRRKVAENSHCEY
jgi:hypothetical protein